MHGESAAPERADDREEGAVLLAEDEDLPPRAGHAGAPASAETGRDPITSPSSCSTARTWCRMSKTASTRARAAAPIEARSAGSPIRRSIAAARAAGSRGGI